MSWLTMQRSIALPPVAFADIDVAQRRPLLDGEAHCPSNDGAQIWEDNQRQLGDSLQGDALDAALRDLEGWDSRIHEGAFAGAWRAQCLCQQPRAGTHQNRGYSRQLRSDRGCP